MRGQEEVRAATVTRPRYARISAALTAALVTLVSVLGGLGVFGASAAQARPSPAASDAPSTAARSTPTPSPSSDASRGDALRLSSGSESGSAATGGATAQPALPAASGHGRRIVFDMDQQRVWLVGQRRGHDVVRRTYPVSGSVTDNLRPGTYAVYSKSTRAWGVDDSGSMRYMVRFTHGANAAIGFHDIPVLNGHLVQTRAQLGMPRSHGCIRQWRPDAKALWDFAPVGTTVVVT
jgi:hypothetical protein